MYPRELILWFPGAPPSVLPMSSLFDVVAAMTTGSWNMILAFLNKDIISGAKQLRWTRQGECLMSTEGIKIYLVLFNSFAF